MHYQVVSEEVYQGHGIVISMETAGEMVGTFETQVRMLNESLENEGVIFAKCDLYTYGDARIIGESFIQGLRETNGNNGNEKGKSL